MDYTAVRDDLASGQIGLPTFNKLKGEIFSEILNYSNETLEVKTANMLKNSGGNTAVFLMENMMQTRPEMVTDVMTTLSDSNFDVFKHMTSVGNVSNPVDARTVDMQAGSEDINTETQVSLKNIQSKVFKEMAQHSNKNTMATMAGLMSSGDSDTAALAFQAVLDVQDMNMDSNTFTTSNSNQEQNLALDLLNNLSNIDSDTVNELYKDQEDLVNNVVNTALTNVRQTTLMLLLILYLLLETKK